MPQNDMAENDAAQARGTIAGEVGGGANGRTALGGHADGEGGAERVPVPDARQQQQPRPAFDENWLKELQKGVEEGKPDYHSLLVLHPSRPRTTLSFPRSGIEGEITGVEEVPLQETNLNAKNSTSLQRQPGTRDDFVRGRTGYYPFAPGGLEDEVLLNAADDIAAVAQEIQEYLKLDDGELETVPPGFERGLSLSTADADAGSLRHDVAGDIFDIRGIFSGEADSDLEMDEGAEYESLERPDEPAMGSHLLDAAAESHERERAEVDELLPEKPLLASAPAMKKRSTPAPKREWAHVVDVNADFLDFHELVPDMAFKYPFELDVFQKRAVYYLEKGDSVFVAAHTSAGKTAVAEYAIALAQRHMTRTIYTSPIKALSNQKFRDFRDTFDDVGILTGDVQIRPEASCLIMTTEILRSMLYRGADLIRDVEFVIFDEVHYVNDAERGVVWEEVIIMLPAHVNLILLSATVPNTKEFADWVGRTKKKDIYVISTPKRPVPLEHYLYARGEIHKIVDARKKFIQSGYKQAVDSISASQKKEELKPSQRGGRGGGQRGGYSRGGGAAGSNRPSSSSGAGSGPNAGGHTATARNMYIELVSMLKKKNLLPTVIFTFSKKKCEEYAAGLSKIALTTAAEKSEVHVFIEKSLTRLEGTDKELPQIVRMKDLLGRGIAVHHGGLLPIIKEIVEILFARGLVRVLFATETFAMGVNMPARTCVFSGIRKHDGQNFRDLLPGEYTQMSGRAGRRGLDDTGIVIIAPSDRDGIPQLSDLNTMILGNPTRLQSQFRLTYNMILNLLRVEALRVEEMIKRSFSENSAQKALPEHQRKILESEKLVSKLPKLKCEICEADVRNFYDASSRFLDLARMMHEKVAMSSWGSRSFNPGRVVMINNQVENFFGVRDAHVIQRRIRELFCVFFFQFYRNSVAVILRPLSGLKASPIARLTSTDTAGGKHFICLLLRPKNAARYAGHAPLPVTHVNLPSVTDVEAEILPFAVADMAVVTKYAIKVDAEALINKGKKTEVSAVVEQLWRVGSEMRSSGIIENDWAKLKELAFQEILSEKQALQKRMDSFQCTKCPNLIEHYALIHGERTAQMKLAELQHKISDQNLELLPDYEQRVKVLQMLKYIDENSTVLLKGRVAAEINTADELILTELIFDNALADYEPAEIVALLSCFVFQEKNASAPNLTPKLQEGQNRILKIAAEVAGVQRSAGLNVRTDDYQRELKFGLVEVVYEWARQMPFKGITELTDVLEGSIVRCIVRLDEVCREVQAAARVIGEPVLYKKIEEAQLAIKRDIVFAASLYFN